MEQLVKVMELDDDLFDEKFELVKSKVNLLLMIGKNVTIQRVEVSKFML